MKRFNYKSRKGFTLIELLVVIGILAVLAAIAIPSVAGLIDRANVSADDTNANEMTNAIERFVSEYELYRQDIASNKIDFNNLDSAQSRVYNSLGIENMDNVRELESDTLFNGYSIDSSTKYPQNWDTATSIITNYIKTSSATFEPKQSDMHFYYSPDCGMVLWEEQSNKSIVIDTNLIEKLNKQIISGKDAKGQELDTSTKWINLSIESHEKGKETNYTLEEIENNPLLFGIGKTKPEYVVAEFNEDFSNVIISKNGNNSDGLMMDWSSPISPMCQNNNTLNSVIFSPNVKSIGNYAFYDCNNVSIVTFNKEVEHIGNSSFMNCSSLNSIKIPSSLKTLGKSSFEGCLNLSSSISIPNTITIIPERCFAYCNKLNSVHLPDTITDIQTWAFFECKNTKITSENDNNNTLYLPNLTNIGNTAFYWCDIKSIILPVGITQINPVVFHRTGLQHVVFEGDVTSIGMSAFIECDLKSITLPDSLVSIGDQAFSMNVDLETIHIPKNVTSIGQRAFNYCRNIKYYTIDSANTNFKIIDGAIYTTDEKTLVSCPSGSGVTSFTVLPSVTNIREGAFGYCELLQTVTLPSGITQIGRETFEFCDALQNISIPEGVTSIGVEAFEHCIRLESIYLPSTISSIDSAAFSNSDKLSTVYGKEDTYAETWATENGYTFIAQ